jgi:predicted dehydrogenase
VSVWHDVLSRPSTRRLELLCRRGVAWLDDDHVGPLQVQSDGGTTTRPCPVEDWVAALPLSHDDIGLVLRMYCPADRAFLDAVAAGTAPAPGIGEAVVAHNLVDAAYRSAAADGSPVSVV